VGATSLLAYYKPNSNELGVPADWLQAPMVVDPTVPTYLSYGSLAHTAGHEIIHGFDPLGSHHDFEGRLSDCGSNSTREAFRKKSECFVEQHNNYAIPDTQGKYHVDG
jgi:endothelin-converting enzyme